MIPLVVHRLQILILHIENFRYSKKHQLISYNIKTSTRTLDQNKNPPSINVLKNINHTKIA